MCDDGRRWAAGATFGWCDAWHSREGAPLPSCRSRCGPGCFTRTSLPTLAPSTTRPQPVVRRARVAELNPPPRPPPPAEAASPADRQALDVVTLPPADPVRGASRSPHAPRSGRRTICTRRYPPIQSLGRDCGGVFSCPPGANARLDLRAACLQPTAASAALKRIICVPMHIYPTLQRKAFGQRASSPCARLSSTLRFCVRASSVRAAPLPEWVEPEASPAERESIHSKPMPALSAAVRPSIQH